MTTLSVADLFPNAKGTREEVLEYLSRLLNKYPASMVLVFAYLKTLKEIDLKRYDLEKKEWLISIFNRDAFLKTQLQIIKPSEAVSEKFEDEKVDELIEDFFQNPPKMRFDPEKHNPSENFAKTSLLEDDELISESLAVIYAEQGYYGKAEKMLKKLALRFPEKSCYFADLFNSIKKQEFNQ